MRNFLVFGLVAGAAFGAAALDVGAPEPGFIISYSAGSHDRQSRFLGGTEMRHLLASAGKLYAGNGFAQDQPGLEGAQGPAIVVLDAPHARWRIETQFDTMMPDKRTRRDIEISALAAVAWHGAPMLLAAPLDRTGASRVFSRDDKTGAWAGATLAQDRPAPDLAPGVTSLAAHRDRVTGIEHVFAGQSPRGIFDGVLDAGAPGHIRWAAAPEFSLGAASKNFPGLEKGVRVTGFAEADGTLFAAVGQQIFARNDGESPHWRLLYTNPQKNFSKTGLRGLTAIGGPGGETLIAAVEGEHARILRIDPKSGAETTELDLEKFIGKEWGTRIAYAIAGFEGMAKAPDPAGGTALLIGLETFLAPDAPRPAGHAVNGDLEAGGWYLVRHGDGHYTLHRIATFLLWSQHPLVAVRDIVASPFAGDDGVYFAGFDTNDFPAHNGAWIYRADRAVVLKR
jgi:hypothetical protein